MYFYHPTFLITLLNVMIILLIGLIGYLTSNPLVIFGLFLLQQTPIVDPTPLLEASMPDEEVEEEVDHGSDKHRIGFHAKLKSVA